MKKYSAEEIEAFLVRVDPLLNGYTKEVVDRFKEVLRHPKNNKERDKANMLLSLADYSIRLDIMAKKDGRVDEYEKDFLGKCNPALKPNIETIVFDIKKQIQAEKQKELVKQQKEAPKKGLWQKIKGFFNDPKTLAVASAILPTSSLADEAKSSVDDNKAPMEIYYSPQSVEEALSSATSLIKKIKETPQENNNNTDKGNYKSSSVKSGGGIAR